MGWLFYVLMFIGGFGIGRFIVWLRRRLAEDRFWTSYHPANLPEHDMANMINKRYRRQQFHYYEIDDEIL